ncbi:hypothetical protein [uncultured Algibacter sp.]|uniref:hypothetical protein n=1 Tax=uncultured Algibacter sp. TaxID=298659 RepID=UPI0026365088|nr:hypothetical protein [uncultured Algibacter sp.]
MLIVIEESNFILFLVFIIAIIIFAIIANYFSDKNMILRELKKSKRKSINNAKEGEYVKFVGKALHANKPLIAPLSGKECVYYHTLIEQQDDDGWEKYIEEKRPQDFFIQVNGELAIVKLANHYDFRKVHVVFDFNEETKSSLEHTPNIEKFIKKHNRHFQK